MQSIKFLLVAALAVFATQCRAAEFPISADKVDLRLLVENGAAIARILFKSVNSGLDQAKPHSDKILNELAPEARELIQKTINEVRTNINEEDKRFAHIFTTLTNALNTLKPIKPCSDKVSPAAKKLALATEKEFAKIIQDVEKKFKKELDNIKAGTKKVIQSARTLFDKEVAAVIECLTPGRKDASTCLKQELNKTLEGTTKVVLDAIILSQTAQDTLAPILPEVIEKALPLLSKTVENGLVILTNLGDCVAALKPNIKRWIPSYNFMS